jgi:effector-binding domain-containing protein
MPYHVELANVDPTLTAVICGRFASQDLPQFVPAACGEVWSFMRAAGLPKPGHHIALYLDALGSIEVGAEVAEPFVGNERVHCSQLPGGRVATTVHLGPYGGLVEAHRAIRRWCAQQGYSCSEVSWEIYGHWEERWNADPSQIRTDVFCLLDDPNG